MSDTPYLLARASTIDDERHYHRQNLVHRLRCIAEGGELRLRHATVARRRGPASGASIAVKVIEPGGDQQHLGYVFHAGVSPHELKERLEREIERQDQAAAKADRRAA